MMIIGKQKFHQGKEKEGDNKSSLFFLAGDDQLVRPIMHSF
jgi:hypothetical protein